MAGRSPLARRAPGRRATGPRARQAISAIRLLRRRYGSLSRPWRPASDWRWAPRSGRSALRRCPAPAGWARSTARTTPSSDGPSRSRCCLARSRGMPTVVSDWLVTNAPRCPRGRTVASRVTDGRSRSLAARPATHHAQRRRDGDQVADRHDIEPPRASSGVDTIVFVVARSCRWRGSVIALFTSGDPIVVIPYASLGRPIARASTDATGRARSPSAPAGRTTWTRRLDRYRIG